MKAKVMTATDYRTGDLYLAAYLLTVGVSLERILPLGSRVEFIFPASAWPHVEDYLAGRGQVDPRRYARELRDLKARMYDVKPIPDRA